MRFSSCLILLIALLALLGCKPNVTAKVVVIQPLGDFSPVLANNVYEQIRKIHPSTIVRSNILLPASAYYPPRNRYRADSLINFLRSKISGDTVVIGLTDKDISTTKGAVKDWGVMGLGFCPGAACVVSTFRLSNQNSSTQFYKVAVHELGHTQGLPHCPIHTCFMRDAEGGNPLNEETDFCPKCKSALQSKGWNMN